MAEGRVAGLSKANGRDNENQKDKRDGCIQCDFEIDAGGIALWTRGSESMGASNSSPKLRLLTQN